MPKVTDAHLAARREQIIEAAMTRFAEGGFHSTGMAEVIAATGLSAGAVYRYFPSKEALIRAIVEERVLATAAAAFEHILDEGVDDPIEAISAALGIVDAVSARQGVDLTRVAVQAWGEALRNPDILDVAQGAYAKMRGYLAAVARRAQEHGRLPADADPDEMAKTHAVAGHGLPHPAADHGRRRPRELHRRPADLTAPAYAGRQPAVRLSAPRWLAAVGATRAEIDGPLLGDDVVPDADVVMDRAFTLAATPEEVWPWLVQLGKQRAGWYFPRRVERILPRTPTCDAYRREPVAGPETRRRHPRLRRSARDLRGGDGRPSARARLPLAAWPDGPQLGDRPDGARPRQTAVQLRLRLAPVRRPGWRTRPGRRWTS